MVEKEELKSEISTYEGDCDSDSPLAVDCFTFCGLGAIWSLFQRHHLANEGMKEDIVIDSLGYLETGGTGIGITGDTFAD